MITTKIIKLVYNFRSYHRPQRRLYGLLDSKGSDKDPWNRIALKGALKLDGFFQGSKGSGTSPYIFYMSVQNDRSFVSLLQKPSENRRVILL